MAKKKDFGRLDQAMEQDLNQIQTEQRTLKPSQFRPSMVLESAAKPINDLFFIPVEQLIPFRQKGEGDFSPWSQEEINEMAEKMDTEGSYEPILVRQIATNQYEILAGEQRYRSSMVKGLKSIKAVVFRDCSDEKAMDIFLLTNLHRRTSKISDAIYGWTMFAKTHPKIRNAADLSEAVHITEIANTEKMPITLTQYYRYVKMGNLIKAWVEALDKQQISIRVGYELACFSQEEQTLLLPYMGHLSEVKLNQLRKEKEQTVFTKEVLDQFFVSKRKETEIANRLRRNFQQVRKEITKSIKPEYYDELSVIIKAALDEYLEKYPEYKV